MTLLWDFNLYTRDGLWVQSSLLILLAQLGIVLWGSIAWIENRAQSDKAGFQRTAALSAGIFLLAFVLRWALPTHALLHENRHGSLFDPWPPFNG
jgi:hypothetical protein